MKKAKLVQAFFTQEEIAAINTKNIKLEEENEKLKEAYVGLWGMYATDAKEKLEENKTLEEENKKLEDEIKNLKNIKEIIENCVIFTFFCFLCAGCLCMLFMMITDVIMGFQFVRYA